MTSQLSPIHSEKNLTIASESQVQEALALVDWEKYDGERITASTGGAIYLVMNGLRHLIPNPTTYNNLFSTWGGVVVSDYLVDSIPSGPPLTSGAVLAKGSPSNIYLVTNNQKLWIPNPATFEKFSFSSNKVVTVPDVIINAVQAGPNVG
ncbi:hypothetical protein [Collimonas sp.]|jgi:hypothetical protein|uniref:hypothetical protein n=1 Tax=Collimonas sp. TaxID=1963772 RepID=UPI002B806C26|nr:hypothetical protein [Collimonas sp.]HWW03931.1 hypothetical protein [Collimonas sp.]